MNQLEGNTILFKDSDSEFQRGMGSWMESRVNWIATSVFLKKVEVKIVDNEWNMFQYSNNAAVMILHSLSWE